MVTSPATLDRCGVRTVRPISTANNTRRTANTGETAARSRMLSAIFRGITPFFIADIARLLLVVDFPANAIFLPRFYREASRHRSGFLETRDQALSIAPKDGIVVRSIQAERL